MSVQNGFNKREYLARILTGGLDNLQRYPGFASLVAIAKPVSCAWSVASSIRTAAIAHFSLHEDPVAFHQLFRQCGQYVLWAAQPKVFGSDESARIGPLEWATMTTLSLAFEPVRAREVAPLLQLPPNTRDKDADPLSVKFFGAASAMMLEPEAGPEAADEFVAIASAREKLWVGHAEAMRAVAVRDWAGLPRALAKLAVLHSNLCSSGYYRNQPIHEHLSILGLGIARCAASRGFEYKEVGKVIPAALVNWGLNAADD